MMTEEKLRPLDTFPKKGPALVLVDFGSYRKWVIGLRDTDGRLIADAQYHIAHGVGWLPLPPFPARA